MICSKCLIDRDNLDFAINPSGRLRSPCRTCKKEIDSKRSKEDKRRKDLRVHGITLEELEGMKVRQESKCLICLQVGELEVDHCHQTLVIRGLLCNACNVGLGQFKDNSFNMLKAIDYLNSTPKEFDFARATLKFGGQKARNQKESRLIKRYGLSLSEYEVMYSSQEGKCKICSDSHSVLFVDHCHVNHIVRSLLCTNCNSALGCFKDNPILIQKAIDYLNIERPSLPLSELFARI